MTDNRKQIPLRLSKKLYDQIAALAAEDFRSLNGQIEYLLTESLKNRGRVDKAEIKPIDQNPNGL